MFCGIFLKSEIINSQCLAVLRNSTNSPLRESIGSLRTDFEHQFHLTVVYSRQMRNHLIQIFL